MIKISIFLLFIILSFTSCSQKTLNYKFNHISKKYHINPRTMKAICKHESNYNSYTINVNKSIFNIQKGTHYFNSWISANLYMDTVLDPLGLNYDIGICQINKEHLNQYNLDNEDLLNDDINIDIATRIYKWCVKSCKGNIICALSMYNTGKKHSIIGKKYAYKVLKIRKYIR